MHRVRLIVASVWLLPVPRLPHEHVVHLFCPRCLPSRSPLQVVSRCGFCVGRRFVTSEHRSLLLPQCGIVIVVCVRNAPRIMTTITAVVAYWGVQSSTVVRRFRRLVCTLGETVFHFDQEGSAGRCSDGQRGSRVPILRLPRLVILGIHQD